MLSARIPRRVGAVLAVVVLALGVGAVQVGYQAHAASPSPALLARSVQEPVGTKLRQSLLAQSAQSWRGGPITTSTGETVTVYVSDTYPTDQVTQEYWAEFLAHLTHGPELSTVKLYVAPFAEVTSMCGPQALGCYEDDEIVAIGEPYVDGTTPEEIVRHEYGHHIAFSRSNPPWVAVDWGPKYWASSENVCSKVTKQLAYPGDEGEHYQLNPGEAWAETYRLMDERKAGITTGSWQIVAPSFYPTDAQLQAAEQGRRRHPGPAGSTHATAGCSGRRRRRSGRSRCRPRSTARSVSRSSCRSGARASVALTSANGRTVLGRPCARERGRGGSPRRSAASERSPCA